MNQKQRQALAAMRRVYPESPEPQRFVDSSDFVGGLPLKIAQTAFAAHGFYTFTDSKTRETCLFCG